MNQSAKNIQASQKSRDALYFGIASLALGALSIYLARQGWIWIDIGEDTMAARMKSYYAFVVQSVSLIAAVLAIYYATSGLSGLKGDKTSGQELMALAGAALATITIGIPFYYAVPGFFYTNGFHDGLVLLAILFAPPLIFCFGVWLGFKNKPGLPLKNPRRVMGIIITIFGVMAIILSCFLFMSLNIMDGE